MANQQLKGPRYKYASIDTAPGAAGYWSEPVSLSQERVTAIFFTRSGAGVGTVHLQYKLPHTGSTWQDYYTTESLVDGARLKVADQGAGVKWRAGVKNGNYTSGTIITGYDW